ncbi:MAG: calcium/sodium antiporter [Myxococcales bacterium]|nr:calcium/sodium antiporter [Myxococcales bacterium]MCB9672373.1 calcium/sodium antiporter [Alphaproteobacteria bacterium]
MTSHLAIVGLGVLALLAGSDVAIAGATRLARRLHLSDLVIGLTIVAIGTSLPELATTITGAIASGGTAAEDAAGVALGNIVGSNLFLLTALLGLTGLMRDLPVSVGSIRRDGFVLLGFTAVLAWGFATGTLTRPFGALLLLAFVAYLAMVVRHEVSTATPEPTPEAPEAPETSDGPDWTESLTGRLPIPPGARDGLVVFAGLATVVGGATLVVDHGVTIAETVGIPGTLVGIFVGAATSLPEVVVSIRAASRGTTDMAVGNILGSSITNLGLCLGAAAVAHPVVVPPMLLTLDYPFLAASTVVALLLMKEREELSREEGAVLLVLFALYLALRVRMGT